MVNLSFDILWKDHGAKNGIKDLGEVSVTAEKKFSGMKKAIAGGATAAGVTAGGLLAKGFSDNLDIQTGRAKLSAQLGLTASESAKIGKSAGALYAGNYGDSLDDVNDSIRNVIGNIDGMRDASAATLQDITAKVLDLQSTTGETSEAITRGISQMLRTGLAKNADEALDIITKGFQNGANKSEDFLDTLNEYGTQFRKMGISGAQATGLISQGLKAGARDGDIVADAIKEFSLRAVGSLETTDKKGVKHLTALGQAFLDTGESTKTMYEAQEKIADGGDGARIQLAKMLGGLRDLGPGLARTTDATSLFGTQAEDLGDALYALHPESAAEGLGKVKGAADAMDKTLGETGQARIEMMKRGFEQWTQKMAGSDGALGDVSAAVVGFSGPVIGAVGSVGQLVSGLAAMNAKLLITKTGTLLLTASQKAAKVATGIWTGAQWLLNAALTANPIGLVVVAVALLTAGIVVLYTKSDTARKVINKSFGYIALSMLDMAGTVIHAATRAFGWMPGIGPKLKSAAHEFDEFKAKVNKSLNGIDDEKVKVAVFTEASLYGTKGGHYVGSTFVKYATGGGVYGAGTATSDSIPALLSNGEHVWTAREVQGAGGHGAVEEMRKGAVRGYALGGDVVGAGLAAGISRSREAIAHLTAARIHSYDKVMNQGLTGALNFARQESGKPYIWGAVGPKGYDCSGFMSALLNVTEGRSPHHRRFATGSFPSAGFISGGTGGFQIGSRRGNPGHMAGTILGVNVESSGGIGVHMGKGARGAHNSLFTGVYHLRGHKAGGPIEGDAPFDLLSPEGEHYAGDEIRRAALYDDGGILRPGQVGRNRSGRPERVLTGRQTQAFDQMVRVIDKGMRGGVGPGRAGTEGIDYARLGDHVARAFVRAGVTVKMDSATVGKIIGKNANTLGRTG